MKTRPVEEKQTEEENENENETNNDAELKEEDQKKPAETKPVTEDLWTQIQQKCLESAIQQFPKSTSERWTCIARAVPGKTKVSLHHHLLVFTWLSVGCVVYGPKPELRL